MKDCPKVCHIDCTLRDGGYYTNWDFPPSLVSDYLNVISLTSIDYVEIGFRSSICTSFKGAYAYSTDEHLNSLLIPEDLKICVMINASELINNSNYIRTLESLFNTNASESKVTLVRIACYLEEVDSALLASKWLSKCGYKVGINIMQISQIDSNQLLQVLNKIVKYPITVFYYADSLGSLYPEDIIRINKTIKKIYKHGIGIHAHNNLGLALTNTLKSINEGASWVDTTICGMGRGPGNCKTEEFLIEQNFLVHDKVLEISPLLDLIDKYFISIKNKYKWGTNSYYYLSGKYGIHPSYIQNLLSNSIFSGDDIIFLINKLRDRQAVRYYPNSLLKGISDSPNINNNHTWSPKDLFNNRDVLIIATGPSSSKYKSAIEMFIKRVNPIVIALNTPTPIESNLINFRAACHPIRILKDTNKYNSMHQSLICPFSNLKPIYSSKIDKSRVLEYGLSTKSNTFDFKDKYCILPSPLVLLYAIAVAISGESNRIFITGIDGYPAGDERNIELENYLDLLFKTVKNNTEIASLTPSCYRCIKKISLFFHET